MTQRSLSFHLTLVVFKFEDLGGVIIAAIATLQPFFKKPQFVTAVPAPGAVSSNGLHTAAI